MDINELIQHYPPHGPLVFLTGTPDFSDLGTRILNTYPSVGQLLRVINEAISQIHF
ncbi:hypothetical protein GP475_11015 [Corynebacterium poyangense]|uniref:Uncharacterized protein n=1 Tax=Corynebacterium poyangense TaxID=2684405 RepID=A0A7H0SRC5_9CORY|nr:hypothetical protein [Corynebacterium poyangense]MBZ8176534.1 hypothetical protein [Corynebacterium poyangense]QNQ91100.1 hypothetical protein GP475_11015 [Corynebacterium poyangense]